MYANTTRCIHNHNMDSSGSLFRRCHWILGVLECGYTKCMCFSKSAFPRINRNSSQSRKAASSTECKHQTSKSFPSAFLKTLCRTRGPPHLKPNFLFTDRVPGITWRAAIRSRGLAGIFSSKSQTVFFFTSRGWFRERPMS